MRRAACPPIREDDGHAWLWTAPAQGEGCNPKPRGPVGRAGVAGARVAVIEREPPHPSGVYRSAGRGRRSGVRPTRSTPQRRLLPSSRPSAWNRLVILVPIPHRERKTPTLVPQYRRAERAGSHPGESVSPAFRPGRGRGLRSVCQRGTLTGSTDFGWMPAVGGLPCALCSARARLRTAQRPHGAQIPIDTLSSTRLATPAPPKSGESAHRA